MTRPNQHMLSGFRILDLTRAIAGPTCTRMFAEMGAEVIKIEAAPDGDMTRGYSKFGGERSLHMIQQSLNKKSVCVNLRDPQGMDLVRKLVAQCDVVVENFRPGIMAAMGLDYRSLCALREDIILCSISALGQTGPLAESPGYDYIAQAYAGITSMIGDRDSAPAIPAAAIGDVSTGVTAAFAIAAALLDRYKTGAGQHLDIAILDCYYHCHEVNVHQYSGSGGEIAPTRNGSHMGYICPAGVFRASGGEVVVMAFAQHWADLCAAMNRPELVDAPTWSTDTERLEHAQEVIAMIENWLQTFPDVSTAIAQLEAHGVPCAPVLTVAETTRFPHLLERGTVRTINDRIAGEFQIPGHPIHSSRYAANNDYDAPFLGEHNHEILSALLELPDDEIAALEQAGILQAKDF
jgi:crotonobetainyl-CoA:carnitine CoA-transferase CaiB-like acyl-CoA transferase